MSITISVQGTPAPQGSKKHVGRGRMVETSRYLPAWREAVRKESVRTIGEGWEPLDGPLVVHLDIYIEEPAKSRFGKHPAGPPDLDKLQRAVGDALTQAKVIKDDARIVKWVAEKHWAIDVPGARITIHPKEI